MIIIIHNAREPASASSSSSSIKKEAQKTNSSYAHTHTKTYIYIYIITTRAIFQREKYNRNTRGFFYVREDEKL